MMDQPSCGQFKFEPYKDGYGQTIITGYARIDGWAVGIVANQ
jgi:acetyl-CoA carboxylase carboxyltransferase component